METPPHAWGRHQILKAWNLPCRNTPTCVGKTKAAAGDKPAAEKHPHMRGEDPLSAEQPDNEVETPPHAWGRLFYGRRYVMRSGNTPTCVGKTLTAPILYPLHRKHPHMRGEDRGKVVTASSSKETPPHAWGRLKEGYIPFFRMRNTPTCVGKTPNS